MKEINDIRIVEDVKKILTELVAIETIYKDVDDKNPHGLGVTKIFDYLQSYFKESGFTYKRFENHALEISYGSGSKDFVIPIHLDTVTYEKESWNSDPLVLTERDGYLYGRGTTDNKGPGAIFITLLNYLKENSLETKRRIKLVFLGDEETTWKGVEYYLKNTDKIAEDGIVPDSDFPLVRAEKGVINYYVNGLLPETMDLNYSVKVDDFTLGNVINAVPQFLKAKFTVLKNDTFNDVVNFLLSNNNNRVKVSKINDDQFQIVVEGNPAHASTPWLGKSAFDIFVCTFDNIKFNSSFRRFYEMYKMYFYDDNYGKKLGIESYDDFVGPTTVNLGLATYNQGEFSLSVDVRQTLTIEPKDIEIKLNEAFGRYKTDFNLRHELLYIDKDSKLVSVLMNSYIKVTGKKNSKPFAIGGGTYARAFPNTLAFGVNFSDDDTIKNSDIHGVNENIAIKTIINSFKIYLDVLLNIE